MASYNIKIHEAVHLEEKTNEFHGDKGTMPKILVKIVSQQQKKNTIHVCLEFIFFDKAHPSSKSYTNYAIRATANSLKFNVDEEKKSLIRMVCKWL